MLDINKQASRMTMREVFINSAFNGLMSHGIHESNLLPDVIANIVVAHADALMKRLGQEMQPFAHTDPKIDEIQPTF